MAHYIAKVEGSGEFPIDMLRYDRCCPFRETDSSAAAASYGMGRRVVEVIAIREGKARRAGLPGSPFTPDRWKSFNWTVIDVRSSEGE